MKGLTSNGKAKASGKSKVMSSGSGGFAVGGKGPNNHMAKKDGVGPQPAGTSSPERSPLKRNMASGGNTKMAKFSPAVPQKPGTTTISRKGK